jgi:hypothetical protein
MRTRLILAMLVLAIPFLYAACNMQSEVPAEPKALWEHFTLENNYKDWGQWPDHQGLQDGSAPHGPKHIVYVNQTITDALATPNPNPLPAGSIIVKENYGPDGTTIMAITVMYKKAEFNPAANNWYWVKYLPDGTAEKEGAVEPCINCHGERTNQDYVMVHDFE